jgi:predicted DNA-binding transcriptional regulator AlpA
MTDLSKAGRALTLAQLRTEKGWTFSRQHTHRLVRAGSFPRPFKAHPNGAVNFYDEAEFDAFQAAQRAARYKTA